MSSADSTTATNELWVVYDGECPFCSSYVRLYRIREHTKQVHLIDARTSHPIMEEIRQRNLNLDEGMAVKLDDRFYHGAEAIQLLAILGSGDTIFNRLNQALFRRPRLARRLYPLLVRGRLLTLRLLGRTLIDAA
jgi:predicted DCC family thiol-disulfide oxidoreductase YuxK